MLTAGLNRIHDSGGAPDTAAGVAMRLSSDDLWRVAVMHLAALLRQQPVGAGSPDTGRVQFGSFALSLQYAGFSEADIEYQDRNVSFYADGLEIRSRDGPRTLSNMLLLLHYARDHSDTLVYLPSEIRARRLEAVAFGCSTSPAFTRFICATFPSLQRVVIG
jgi:hypothetical protein